MRPPFPGMDPWLEDPALWPDVHNSLIAAIRDAMAPLVAPKYYVGLESRTYLLNAEELPFVVPDLSVVTYAPAGPFDPAREAAGAGAVEVLVPRLEEVKETYLEVRDVRRGKIVTLIEILSRANKFPGKGRKKYLRKRDRVLDSRTQPRRDRPPARRQADAVGPSSRAERLPDLRQPERQTAPGGPVSVRPCATRSRRSPCRSCPATTGRSWS